MIVLYQFQFQYIQFQLFTLHNLLIEYLVHILILIEIYIKEDILDVI